MSRHALFALALLPFAIACDKDPEDPSDNNMPHCEDVASPLAPEEDGGFGMSGQDLLDAIPAQLDGASLFADDSESNLQVLISVDAESLRAVASEAVYPDTDGPVPDIAVICPSRVEVDAQIQLLTEDGRLAETLEVVLASDDPAEMGSPAGEVHFSAELDHENLEGSLDLADFADLSAYDSVSMSVFGAILDGALEGELSGQGEAVQGNTAMAEMIPVAALQAVAAE